MAGTEAEELANLYLEIEPGMHVHTSDEQSVGTVKTTDRMDGSFVVQHGHLLHHEVHVPITMVESVDREGHAVQLAVSREQLQWVTRIEPEQSLFENT